MVSFVLVDAWIGIICSLLSHDAASFAILWAQSGAPSISSQALIWNAFHNT